MKKLLFFCFFLSYGIISFCCSCIEDEPIKISIKKSHSIFIGTVVDSSLIKIEEKLEGTNSSISHYFIKYNVVIKSLLKGKNYTDTVALYTGIGGGDCGYPFKINSDYIIYANINTSFFLSSKISKPYFYTDICKRTCVFNETELNNISTYIKKPKKRK